MAVAALFEATGTWDQYEKSMIKLEEAGWGTPSARRYHVAGPTDTGFRVVDIWDSPESLQEFAAVLVPILLELGVTPPEPSVWPVENIVS